MEPSRTLHTVRTWGRMVKFSHSVFALPFAVCGAVLAGAKHGMEPAQLFWIVVAMVCARNAAMGFNRLADEPYDRRNPRTAGRELPRGSLSRPAVWAFTVALSAIFVVSSFELNRLCGLLSPVALLLVMAYSYTKRFTWASHLVLGVCLGMAPVGGWLAVAGSFSSVAWLLAAAVVMWVAGFDVIYSCQDVEFDRREGLHSIPARFGVRPALAIARLLHAGAVVALAGVGLVSELHPVYWLGLLVIGGLLVWEHRLVRAEDLSKVPVAFFNMNGIVGVVYLAATLLAVLLPPRSG